MPWKAQAIGAGASLLGGLMGGGSRAGERASRDAAARASFLQEQSARTARDALQPYQESGRNATRTLSELLGIADPVGFAPRPELIDFENQLRDEHFRWAGRDYTRGSNIAGQTVEAKRRYDEALKNWEQSKAEFQAQNPESMGSGSLLKQFTNEDFVKDPGYNFRMMEGEKGINRSSLARGGFDSGAALKELNRFNQDFASNEFGNAYNRDAADKARTFGFLSDRSNQGLSAAGQMAGVATNTATNIGNIGINQANQQMQNQQMRDDNNFNAVQNTIGNLVYGFERNRNNPFRTPDFNPNMTGGFSSLPRQKLYL